MYICEEKTVIIVYTIVVTLTLVQISEVWYWNLHVIHIYMTWHSFIHQCWLFPQWLKYRYKYASKYAVTQVQIHIMTSIDTHLICISNTNIQQTNTKDIAGQSARLGVSRTIYVNEDSPNLGFPYFNFLGGPVKKNHPVYMWLIHVVI